MNLLEKVKFENIPYNFDVDEILSFVKRLTNEKYAKVFKVTQIKSSSPYDEYSLYCKDGYICVEATSGVAFATAFNYYLNHYCHYYIGFVTESGKLPANPPLFNEKIENRSKFLYRYFLNYCTFGYSFAYFTKDDFEHLLDVIFLNGYNLVLNPIGQECVWHDLLLKLGYSEKEIKDFLVPQPFMPWFNMMNMSSEAYDYNFEERKELARFFNERLFAFGASSMKVGYAGMVPGNYSKKFKGSLVKDQGLWCGYNRPQILLYEDKNYDRIAKMFYEIQDDVLGFEKSHYYSIDPFHEGGIKDGIDLPSFAKHNFELMRQHDSKAIWSFQGWEGNPDVNILKGLKKEDVLVINLKANIEDFGYPYVFGCVNNYGGKKLLRGNIKEIIEHSYLDNIGIGMLPEGVENSEILFDLFSFMAVNNEKVSVESFLEDYALCHFQNYNANIKKYLRLLADKIYVSEDQIVVFESPYNATPSLTVKKHINCSLEAKDIYPIDLLNASSCLLDEYESQKENQSYIFELIDTIRQTSGNYGWHLVFNIQKAYKERNYKLFKENRELFEKLLDLQINLLSNHKNFTLSNYLRRVNNDVDLYLSKRLITSWADIDVTIGLNDYAMREYSELLEEYTLPRWIHFLDSIEYALKNNTNISDYDYIKDSVNFVNDKKYQYKLRKSDLYKTCEEIIQTIKENKF